VALHDLAVERDVYEAARLNTSTTLPEYARPTL
jgi:hypothetical protein